MVFIKNNEGTLREYKHDIDQYKTAALGENSETEKQKKSSEIAINAFLMQTI